MLPSDLTVLPVIILSLYFPTVLRSVLTRSVTGYEKTESIMQRIVMQTPIRAVACWHHTNTTVHVS